MALEEDTGGKYNCQGKDQVANYIRDHTKRWALLFCRISVYLESVTDAHVGSMRLAEIYSPFVCLADVPDIQLG